MRILRFLYVIGLVVIYTIAGIVGVAIGVIGPDAGLDETSPTYLCSDG